MGMAIMNELGQANEQVAVVMYLSLSEQTNVVLGNVRKSIHGSHITETSWWSWFWELRLYKVSYIKASFVWISGNKVVHLIVFMRYSKFVSLIALTSGHKK